MAADYAMAFEDKAAMAAALRRMATPGDSILFKGSRGMRMEQVLQEFLKEEA
jgi:UDP-N-acetylmuramoyl-tripeptide--D-alanyl-D-alanine ligase